MSNLSEELKKSRYIGLDSNYRVVDKLNEPTMPGSVPIIELRHYAIESGLLGTISVIADTQAQPTNIRALCKTIEFMIQYLPEVNVHSAVFSAGMNVLLSLGVMRPRQREDIIRLADNRVSVAKLLLGREATIDDVIGAT